MAGEMPKESTFMEEGQYGFADQHQRTVASRSEESE